MAFQIVAAAKAASALATALGVADFFVSRSEASDTTSQLDEVLTRLDEVRGGVDTVSQQVLALALAQSDVARVDLEALQTSQAPNDAAKIAAIVTNAQGGLISVLNQAEAILGGAPSFDTIASVVNALSFASNLRIEVATRLEGGAVGKDTVRGLLERTESAFADVEQAYRDVHLGLDSFTTVNNVGGQLPGGEPPHRNIGVVSTITDFAEIERIYFTGLFGLETDEDEARADDAFSVARSNQFRNDLEELGEPEIEAVKSRLASLTDGTEERGTSLGDTLSGSAGNDYIDGGAGDDAIDGGADPDGLVGGSGDDTLRGEDGADILDGGTGRDMLAGGIGNDLLIGGAGDDEFDGGSGIDKAKFVGGLADYTVEGGELMARVSGPDGADTLFSVSELIFDDQIVTLETGIGGLVDLDAENAREVAYLYEAGLDRDGDIDNGGLNFWIDRRGDGLTEEELAQVFLESPEFRESFGNATDPGGPDYLSDEALVDRYYQNVLERSGDPRGEAFWLDRLAEGVSRAQVLLSFANGPENREGSRYIESLREVEPGEWDFDIPVLF